MLWGIDLGGTKIEGIVLESYDNPKEVSRIRINTEAEKGYNHVFSDRLIHVLAETLSKVLGRGNLFCHYQIFQQKLQVLTCLVLL